MIPPDDPRHGTPAGRKLCSCDRCKAGINRYNQLRMLAPDRGRRYVDATGSRRRLQALAALGYSYAYLAGRLGLTRTALAAKIRVQDQVHVTSAAQIRRLYDELSMRLPVAATPGERMSINRTRALAARRGWLPPLMWDDGLIDDPDHDPTRRRSPSPKGQRRPRAYVSVRDDVDEAVVLRVLAGERLDTTPAERVEIVRRWLASGRSEADLCRITGWRGGRYVERLGEVS